MLCDIVAKGGNLALNIGPRPDGRLPEPVYPILQDIGKWLNKNGYAIYGTRPCSPYRKDMFAYTSKGDEMYAIYLPDENDNSNTLPDTVTIPVSEKISQVFFNGNSLEFIQNDNSITVNTGTHHQTEIAYVFTLKKS